MVCSLPRRSTGEDDAEPTSPTKYATCLADLAAGFRDRWGVPGAGAIPFMGSGLCSGTTYVPMYRKSAGQGRFAEDFEGVPSLEEKLPTGKEGLGFAGAWARSALRVQSLALCCAPFVSRLIYLSCRAI